MNIFSYVELDRRNGHTLFGLFMQAVLLVFEKMFVFFFYYFLLKCMLSAEVEKQVVCIMAPASPSADLAKLETIRRHFLEDTVYQMAASKNSSNFADTRVS